MDPTGKGVDACEVDGNVFVRSLTVLTSVSDGGCSMEMFNVGLIAFNSRYLLLNLFKKLEISGNRIRCNRPVSSSKLRRPETEYSRHRS